MAETSNHLIHEKSPYLLQHAHNPVDWYPWGETAFEKARREQKPIFLSIGYSTCHWCHVMERESFENPEIAKLMNEHFVNIKVDREERPDVDRIYMAFVQATTGGGGWPMSVWLTPDLKPFVGGTYFPPESKGGHPGFPDVLRQIARAWKEDRARILESSDQVMEALQQATTAKPSKSELPVEAIPRAYDQLAASFDKREGGFGGAPKFPRPVALELLFRIYAANPESENGRHALEMTLFTLRKMATGGMHDQLGGGFHRYSVDGRWHVPHFEKMLYDQAQLANAYTTAFQITRDPQYAAVARDTLDYVLRDLADAGGAFYTAEDADSPLKAGEPERAEGAFYVWTGKELSAALGKEEAEKFSAAYGAKADGNVPSSADPHGELTGKNVLFAAGDVSGLDEAHEKLLTLRNQRPRPHLDDKILTSWNGLIISALARAGAILDEPRYVEAAKKSATFIRNQLYKDGRLLRSYREGAGKVGGFADDYAFLIEGLLDLYEASADATWLTWAAELQETQDKLFLDPAAGGYFMTTGDDASVLLRMKEDYDGAEPSANSISALNLARLAVLFDRPAWRTQAEATINAFRAQLINIPTAMPRLLVAVEFLADKPRQIVLAGPADSPLRTAIRQHYLPNSVLLYPNAPNPELENMAAIDGQPTAYVCENFVCQLPVTTVPELTKLLERSVRQSRSAAETAEGN